MTSLYQRARFLPAGDKALAVELGDGISPEINRRVRDFFLAIEKQRIEGIVELIPTYRSILVHYDPLRLNLSELEERLRDLEEHTDTAEVSMPKVVEFPLVYGGEYGPDLGYVAGHNGLSEEEVIAIHSGDDYLVYAMGFTPGFPYMGGMSEKIATPRLQSPRTSISAGSVGIAERQTGVYPIASPGGWQLIGRTPLRLFDPDRHPPALVDPGDYVRFLRVDEGTFLDIQRQVLAGSYQVTTHQVQ